MRGKTAWIAAATTAGGLLLAGVTATAAPGAGHSPARAQLAAYSASAPSVVLDNCPVLAQGYQGGCVNQLQTELNTIDNAGLPVDGIFGPQTRQAVITFQQNNGVSPADGIVGPLTKAALDRTGAPAVPGSSNGPVILDSCPTLAQGSQGGCVSELQTELNIDDNAGLPVDGIFGPLTRQAVITFQQQLGVTPADGIVGPQTKGALDVSNSVSTPGPGAPLGPGDPGSASDGGKSLSECLGELGVNLGLEDFARKQAAARGFQLADLGGPWAAGAEMAGCILFGI